MADCWNWSTTTPATATRVPGGRSPRCTSTSATGWGRTRTAYVFGFSAGAAFTPNLIGNYNDLFSAAGIHSGLEWDDAETATGGTWAMATGGPDPCDQAYDAYQHMGNLGIRSTVPTTVVQGTDDSSVEPPNGKQAVIQAATTDYYVNGGGIDYSLDQADHTSGWDGKRYDRYEFTDGSGNDNADLWRIDGLGHDWVGGWSGECYTDPDAPEATKHIFDFFGAW